MKNNTEITEFVEAQQSQMRRGLIVYSVLLLCDGPKMYSSEIIKRLQQADLIVVEGTLYPLLSRLVRDKFLLYEWQESAQGPPRKYYWLSDSGKQALTILKKQYDSINASIKQLEKGTS